MNLLKQFLQLITCILLLLTIAINKDGRVFNHSVDELFVKEQKEKKDKWSTDDGYNVISTHNIAKDIFGYAGNIPLHIFIKDNIIEKIEVQQNSESPDFLASVINNGLLTAWNGLTLGEAINKDIDATTGATLSSSAIIESVNRALQYATNSTSVNSTTKFKWKDIRFWAVLVVIIAAMTLPIFYKNGKYRTIQLFLNMAVLGFWSGSFISLSLLVNFFSNGLNIWLSIIPVFLLISAFIYPLFGKKSHYCTWVCPMGSCQELLGKRISYKIKLSQKQVKYLYYFRESLWFIIMGVMLTEISFKALDYELFSAFLFTQASLPIIIGAIIFAILSCFIQRPYCRFVCPTGSLLKYTQQTK
ncbi:MAG: FMN-binding protein [Marinifilaceae bacterium]